MPPVMGRVNSQASMMYDVLSRARTPYTSHRVHLAVSSGDG